jgi:subtilisin-like proprotein convertase family protein
MPAANHNFTIEQGSAFEIVFEFIDSNNSPVNLTNWCSILQWKDNADNTQIFNTNYEGNDYRMFVSNTGKITLQIPARITKDYNFTTATYDLDLQEPNEQYTNSGLKTYRLSTGTITILKRNTPSLTADCASANIDFDLESCNAGCDNLDPYAVIYNGGSVSINDLLTNTSSMTISDSRTIENIDVVIQGLNHPSPQDLIFILEPPTGQNRYPVILSMNSKILNYKPGFSFVFSERAPVGSSLYSVMNNKSCRLTDKTNIFTLNSFNNATSNFSHLIGNAISGSWSLKIIDSDSASSGSISNWALVITYSDT